MKTIFGSFITEGSGKIGGQVISRNHYGTFTKTKVTPYNPQSSRQLAVRANQKTITQLWSTLSDSQRLGWIKESELHPQKDRFGKVHYLSGFGLFTKCNVVRLNLSLSALTSPVALRQFVEWNVISIKAFSLNPAIWLFLTPLIPRGFYIQVFGSKVVSPGINYIKGQLSYLGYISDNQSFPVNLYPLWLTKYTGTLNNGYAILFELRLVDLNSGFVSNSVKYKCVIESGYLANQFNTFTDLGQQFSQVSFYALSYAGSGIVLGGLSPSPLIIRSTNYGTSFSIVYTAGAANAIRCFSGFKNGINFAGCGGNGHLLKSLDFGATWSDLGTFYSAVNVLCSISIEEKYILFGLSTSGKIIYSSDQGSSFIDLGQQFSQTAINCFCYAGHGVVYAGTSPGGLILRSLDYGRTWSNVGSISGQANIRSITSISEGIIIVGTGQNAHILRKSTNDGSFVDLGSFLSQLNIYSLQYIDNGFVLAGTNNSGLLMLSKDYGQSFISLGQQFSQSFLLCFLYIPGYCILIGTNPLGKLLRYSF